MASLTDVILAGKGKAHAWQVTQSNGVCRLYHYSTCMLVWNVDKPHDPEVLDYDLGWGSVSDQGGMNRAFTALGIPLRYDRSISGGGPRIVRCGTVKQAKQLRSSYLKMRRRHAWVR